VVAVIIRRFVAYRPVSFRIHFFEFVSLGKEVMKSAHGANVSGTTNDSAGSAGCRLAGQ